MMRCTKLFFTAFAAACALAAYAGPACADAGDVLDRAVAGAAAVRSLETDFAQEKTIPFVDVPLLSSGKLCFALGVKAGVPGSYIFWEYREPARTGFQYETGQARFWTGDGDGKPAGPAEQSFLRSLIDQMLAWIALDRRRLQAEYDITAPAGAERTLKLVPRRRHPLFASIELVFNPGYAGLARLVMTGHEGDVTRLSFAPGRRNAPLSADCRRGRR